MPGDRGLLTKEDHLPKNPHTGGKAPQSGIYRPTNGGKGIAVSKGDTLPPSKQQGTTTRSSVPPSSWRRS